MGGSQFPLWKPLFEDPAAQPFIAQWREVGVAHYLRQVSCAVEIPIDHIRWLVEHGQWTKKQGAELTQNVSKAMRRKSSGHREEVLLWATMKDIYPNTYTPHLHALRPERNAAEVAQVLPNIPSWQQALSESLLRQSFLSLLVDTLDDNVQLACYQGAMQLLFDSTFMASMPDRQKPEDMQRIFHHITRRLAESPGAVLKVPAMQEQLLHGALAFGLWMQTLDVTPLQENVTHSGSGTVTDFYRIFRMEPIPALEKAFPEEHVRWNTLMRTLTSPEQFKQGYALLSKTLCEYVFGEDCSQTLLSTIQALDASAYDVVRGRLQSRTQAHIDAHLHGARAHDLFNATL